MRVGDPFAQLGQLLLLGFVFFTVRLGQRLTLLHQTIAARGNDLQGTLRMAAMGQLDLQALVGLRHRRPLPADRLLRFRLPIFGQRQALLLRRKTHLALLDAVVRQGRELGPALVVFRQALKVLLPERMVVVQLGDARLVFLLRFAPMPDFGLKARHLGVGFEQAGLGGMHPVAAGEMGLARLLDTCFGLAQTGILGFEVDHRAVHLAQ